MNWRILRVAGVTGLALLASLTFALLIISKGLGHSLMVKAYFTDAMGLRSGARVRLAGVDVGTVETVRAKPVMKDIPVEVVMSVNTAENLRIPNDSTVSLETAGVLGETFVEIDSHSASGPPVQSGGTLKAQSTISLTAEQLFAKFAAAFNLSNEQAIERLEAVIKERCNSGGKNDRSGAVSKGPTTKSRDAN